MQIRQFLFAMSMALTATAAPTPPRTGYPKDFTIIFPAPTNMPSLVNDPRIPLVKRGAADIVIPEKWACPDDAKTPMGNGFEALFRNTFGIPPGYGWPDEPFP